MLEDRVLFIDGEAIVIDKPAGLPVDTPRDGSRSVESMLGDLTFGFRRLPVPVHRLDRDTSGCLILSRNPKAQKRFQAAFEARAVAKRYVAILDGIPDADSGTVDLALGKTSSAERGWRMIGDPRGKPALTHWRVIARENGRALVEFTPETGRTHQIRVHAADGIGLPILGDPVYDAANGSNARGPMMLHATAITLRRGGKDDIAATSPLPDRFTKAGFADA